MKRCLGRCFVLAVLCLSLAHPSAAFAAAKRKKVAKPQPDRYASIVIDAVSGEVLSERNADRRLYPASLTKMMTLYLTFEAIQNGTLRKSTRLSVSARAAGMEPSKLGLERGSTLRVEDAILGLVTKSANDAAVVLAEGIAGSEPRFAQRMTAKARALGMRNTRFMNASGLFHPEQVSSARDMAILSRSLMRDFPYEYRYFSTRSFTFAGHTYHNHNKLMQTYAGMDGLKTGYVHQSGFNLAASAVRGGRRLIGVVFGGRTTASRNKHMAELLDRGFASLSAPRLAAKGPRFDAMGLALRGEAESGEGDATEPGLDAIRPAAPPASLRPPAARAVAAPAYESGGKYVVQIGSFSSKASGLKALKDARARISKGLPAASDAIVVPLVTSRGTIYRARLTGLSRAEAENACRVLKGNCLILATQ